ncbi:MAG: dimethylsulfonioproprionate lyase family protein [Oricola sp.]
MPTDSFEKKRQIAYLHTEPGLPGSGRLRYASAMYLRQQGELSDAALEVYRICAIRDQDDPAPLLAERGLESEIPPGQPLSPEDAIRDLVDAADRYLTALDGPGVAEVRSGIGTWRAKPVLAAPPRPNALVASQLHVALEALAGTRPSLADAIAVAAPHLQWITYDGYPADEIGADFCAGHAYASIIGEDAPIRAEVFDFGLFLIEPHVLYRDHRHKAPELYTPLTGPHGWRFDPSSPLVIKQAHEPVWNEPFAPHMTKVGPLPFLCFFGWTQDVNEAAQVIPAADWADLETMRLDA